MGDDDMEANRSKEVTEYIAQYPDGVQERLNALRALITETVPEAAEKISWGMPTYTLRGNLIHFAAQKHHIGLYPGPDAVVAFADRLAEYKTSKGAIQLPNDKPLPLDLVRDIVAYNVKNRQNAEKA